jgi:hypothetical protein
MDRRQIYKRIFGISISILIALATANCTFLTGGSSDQLPQAEITAPAPTIEGFQQIASPLCQVGDYPIIQTEKAQGDLVAWSGEQNEIAFVGPSGGVWGWDSGVLVLVTIGDNSTPGEVHNLRAFGDVTWSPDGTQVGVVALRPDGKLYTVMVVNESTLVATDLMPGTAAATDTFASPKGIEKWENAQNLVVTSGCGSDCVDEYSINLNSRFITQNGQIRKSEDHSLVITLNQPTYDETLYPAMINPDWSPDLTKITFLDENDDALVFDTEKQGYYPIDVGALIVGETKWSADSRYLAIRAEGHLYIFDTQCP